MTSSILFACFLFVSVNAKDYFRAAVFEHRPEYMDQSGMDPQKIINTSLKVYARATQLAAQNGADIIVFNEYGIVGYPHSSEGLLRLAEEIPDPQKVKSNPCLQSTAGRHILHTLSCLARENNIYLVANMVDKHSCQEICGTEHGKSCDGGCQDDSVLTYNSNVAFDREGNIVARYHKQNPYFEIVNIPNQPDIPTFDTDFGRFAMIVCFDSVFKDSVLLAKDHGIDTMLYPTDWFDDILPLNAVEFEQSWALANKVNFLGANSQKASLGTLGSGIYSKENGALVYTYEPDGYSKLLLANVKVRGTSEVPIEGLILVVNGNETFPKNETGELFPEYCFKGLLGPPVNSSDYRCSTIQTENYTLVKLVSPSDLIRACDDGFCCSLNYSAEEIKDNFYLGAFNGLNNVRGYYEWWEETCLLVRCDPLEGEACALLSTKSKTVFHKAVLKAKFQSQRIYPTVSATNARLVPKQLWQVVTTDSEAILTFEGSSHPLLKIGLMGRSYDRDPPYVPYFTFQRSSGGNYKDTVCTLLLFLLSCHVITKLTLI